MCGIKIPLQDFALKCRGGAYVRGGAYLQDTTVLAMQLPTHSSSLVPRLPLWMQRISLVPRPLPRKVERGSGVLIDISCYTGRGLQRKECHIYILHPGLEFSDDLDCCTVWFTKT